MVRTQVAGESRLTDENVGCGRKVDAGTAAAVGFGSTGGVGGDLCACE